MNPVAPVLRIFSTQCNFKIFRQYSIHLSLARFHVNEVTNCQMFFLNQLHSQLSPQKLSILTLITHVVGHFRVSSQCWRHRFHSLHSDQSKECPSSSFLLFLLSAVQMMVSPLGLPSNSLTSTRI